MIRFLHAVVLLLAVASMPAWAQISIRSTAQAGVTSGNLVIPKPSGANANDVLVAAVTVVPADRAINTPLGWTQVSNESNGANARLAVFTRLVTVADAAVTNYTFTFGGGTHSGAAGGIAAFIGVDIVNPVNVSLSQGTPAAFAHAAPSITTTVRGTVLVGAFAMPGATEDWLPPPGMIEAVDVTSTGVRPGATGVALTLTIEPLAVPGATGTRTATADETGIMAAAGRTAALALRPALAPANTHYRLDGAAGSLNGTAGEVFDSGGTGLHGFRRVITTSTTANLVVPNPTIHGQDTAVSGQFCNAAQFDGGAVLQVPASPQFDYTQEFSASAWIYPTAAPSGGGLYSVLSNDQNYEFHLNSSRRLNWWWGGGVRELTSNAQIPLNRWTHVAITFRSVAGSARQRIYINGVLDTSVNNWQGTLNANGCNFYIGGDVSTGSGCGLIADRAFRGMIDEVKLYNYELTAVEVNNDRIIGRNCASAVSRYRIEHDGEAHSCAAENITIRACANADCSSLSSAGAAGTLSAGGNSVGFSIPVGQTSTSVSLLLPTTSGPPDPEAVRLTISSVSPVPALVSSCRNGAGAVDTAAACDVSVADAGFILDVPDHVADTVQTASIRAIRRTAGDACVPLFANVTRNVGFWANYSDPTTGTRTTTLAGATLGSASPGTPLSLSFDGNGRATATLRYADAGAVRLDARYAGGSGSGDAGLVVTGNDTFIARPARFQLTVPGHNASAALPADATRPVFGVAGAPFPVSVQAVNASGVATPNFGREAIPEGVRFESVLQAPTGGRNPTPVAAGFSAWANGASTGTVRFDEVGVITLRPRLANAPYLNFVDNGSPLVTGDVVGMDVERVGRFRPARLGVAPNLPTFANACAAGGFGYLGQEFGFATSPQLVVTAFNARNEVTGNYVNGSGAANAFWTFVGALANRSYTSTANGTVAPLSRTTNGGDAAVTEQTATTLAQFDGIGRVTVVGDRLTYAKPPVPERPFVAQASLTLTAADLTDSDGVCFDTAALDGCDPLTVAGITGSEQRWGRIAVTNAFGPEVIDLRVPMRAEFFNGTTFVANTADACSGVSIVPLADANPGDTLVPVETCVHDSGSPGTSGQGCSTAGPVDRRYTSTPGIGAGGAYMLWLRAPGVGNVGVLDLTPSVPAWLQFNWRGTGNAAPTARVGFGVFQGDRRAIHEREVY